MNVAAVILAGGESRRMGTDKAWLRHAGETLLSRAVRTVREAGIVEVYISGRSGVDYGEFGCAVLLDGTPGLGPLGGVEQALDVASAPLLLVLAVDMPRMSAALLRSLMAACGNFGVVPSIDGAFEPLAAIYPRSCLELVRDCLQRGRLSARSFARECVQAGQVQAFPISAADASHFENWNSASDIGAV